jgi:MFS family permease
MGKSATQIVSVAVGYQLYDETGSALLLGIIGLVQFLPALALVLVTGLASDKFGRRRVMGGAIVMEMLCALTITAMALSGRFDPIIVLSALTVFGIARAFYSPAASSLVVNVVPTVDFANAVGWVTLSWQLASIVGASLGGVLLFFLGPFAYLSAAGVFAVAATMIFSIPKPNQTMETDPVNWQTIVGGFRYIWQRARGDFIGSVRRASRRRRRAFAHLCERYFGGRVHRQWPAARRAGRWRDCNDRPADPLSGQRLCGNNLVGDRRFVWSIYSRFRPVKNCLALDLGLGLSRRFRHDQRLYSRNLDAALDARSHARAGQCGQLDLPRRE